MKALVQRVTQASVTVDRTMLSDIRSSLTKKRVKQSANKVGVCYCEMDGNVISSIGKGICVLIGISRKDAPKDLDYIVRKILNLRVFEDDDGKRWNKSVMDKKYEVLCVSQFTLEMVLKGNKPDFHEAMTPELSETFYNNFLQQMRENYSAEKVKDGVFGAMMQVHIQNDGPVTISLESPDNLPDPKVRKPQGGSKKAIKDGANEASKLQSQSAADTVQGATGDS